jgi:hypothetical protein
MFFFFQKGPDNETKKQKVKKDKLFNQEDCQDIQLNMEVQNETRSYKNKENLGLYVTFALPILRGARLGM